MDKKFTIINKRNLLLFFSIFCIYSGYAVGNKPVLCFGFAMVFLLLFSWHAAHNFFRDFRGDRLHYPRTFENEQLRVKVRLEPGTSIPLYMLETVDTFPAGDSFWIKSLIPHKMNADTPIEQEYQVRCTRRRGVYILGPLKIRGSDPVGIFSREKELPVITDLLLYPQAPDLDVFEVLEEGTLSQIGIETVLRPGHSEEFTGLREYHRGDYPNRIHWPSSTRHEKLLVKEFREDISTEVTILMDLHRLSLSGVGDVTTVEYIIKSAAAVSRKAIDKCHLVQVYGLGEKVEHIPLGGGNRHLINILDRLTYLRAKGEGTFHEALRKYAPMLKFGSTAVLISSATNIKPSEISPILRQMISRRIRVIVILIDDRSFIKFWKDQGKHRRDAVPLGELKGILSEEGCGLFLISKGQEIRKRLQIPLA